MKRKRTFQVACGLFNSCNQLGINFPFTTKPRGLLRMRGLTFALLLVLGCAATTERTFGQSNSVLHGKLSGSSLLLNWNSRGDLESSPALNGPWNTLSNVAAYTGSAVQTASSDKRFFRVRDGYRNGSALPFPAVKPLPRIQSASIQRLAAPTSAGDTKLEVVFEPGQNIGSSNYFVLDEQLYLLRDDGVFPDTQANNGIHTVIVPFSTNDMIAWNDHLRAVPSWPPIHCRPSTLQTFLPLRPFPFCLSLAGWAHTVFMIIERHSSSPTLAWSMTPTALGILALVWERRWVHGRSAI